MQRAATVLAVFAAGCGYPDFRFDAVAADAGEDTFEPVDSAVDTTVEDTFRPDAGGDVANDATPDVAKSGCAGITADFCADFDSVAAPGSGWSGADAQGAGTLALDSISHSSPKSFFATVVSGTLSTAFLYKNFTAKSNTTPMRAEAWIQLEAATFPTSAGSAFLLKLERSGSAGDGVTFSIDGAGLFADRIGNTYERWPLAYKITPGAWIHVRVDAVLHTTAGSLTVWIDDMTAPVLSKVGISTAQADTTARSFDLGLFGDRATGTFRARFDDVSFSFL